MEYADLDLNKVYTYADYLKWQFEERLELIKGKIFKMAPAPGSFHQNVTGDIFYYIRGYLQNKTCKVFVAPFDVRLPRKPKENQDQEIITVLQPDVCVVCNPNKIDKRGCIGAPDLVVEVLSPGNNSKELKNKFDAYEEGGVREYWVVSPQNQTIQVFELVNGRYNTNKPLVAGDTLTTPILPGFSLDMGKFFEGLGGE